MYPNLTKFFLLSLTILFCFGCDQKVEQFDLVIENGTVYNGFDTIPSANSVAIRGDSIAFIGNLENHSYKAKKTIDAKGLIVCPGFIDPHTHADKDLIEKETSANLPFLMQGITTVVIGNDGGSLFPVQKTTATLEEIGVGTNVVQLTGHGTLRKQILGESDRKPTIDELEALKNLVKVEMESGAFGMSTGLFYKPGSYSDTKEVIELAKVVSSKNGIYDTHLRDESTFSVGLVKAVKEALSIGEQAQIPIHISHIKCLGVEVWNQSDSIIGLIENAKKKGLNVTANQYPYEASATSLQAAVIPRWAESGGKDSLFIRYGNPLLRERILIETQKNIERRGGPDKLLLVRAEDSSLIGENLLQVSQNLKISPAATVLEILKNNFIKVASFNMHKEDIKNFMKQKWVVTGSDGGSGHPRKYGSFPRKYRKYVVEDKTIPLHRFINNSTSKTSEILKLSKRGRLSEGFYADIIVLDPDTFTDKASYTEAYEYAEGLEYVIINGQISVENREYNQKPNGRVLKK